MLEHAGPSISELQSIVGRLATEFQGGPLDRSEPLQIEITLRGMLPTLEGLLQYAVGDRGESEQVIGADRAIMLLSQHLQWIQLHAHAPLDHIAARVDESVRCAELILQHLSP